VRFCDRCGSYMERGLNGLVCPKCGYEVAQSLVEVRRPDRPSAEPVYVVESVAEGSLKVTPSAATTRHIAPCSQRLGSTRVSNRTGPLSATPAPSATTPG